MPTTQQLKTEQPTVYQTGVRNSISPAVHIAFQAKILDSVVNIDDELGSTQSNHKIVAGNGVQIGRSGGKLTINATGGGSGYSVPIITGFDIPSLRPPFTDMDNLGGTRELRYHVTNAGNVAGDLTLQVSKNNANYADITPTSGRIAASAVSSTITIPEDDIRAGDTWRFRLCAIDTQDTPVTHYSQPFIVSVPAAPGPSELAYFGAQDSTDFTSYNVADASGSVDVRNVNTMFDVNLSVPAMEYLYILLPEDKDDDQGGFEIRALQAVVTRAFTMTARVITLNSVRYDAYTLHNNNSFSADVSYQVTTS